MSEDFATHGVQVLGVCADTPAQITRGMGKHGLAATFLADPDARVSELFGLRNLTFEIRPTGVAGLPVPTTLLVNAAGIVCWKDQSRNYTRLKSPAQLRAALAEHDWGRNPPRD